MENYFKYDIYVNNLRYRKPLLDATFETKMYCNKMVNCTHPTIELERYPAGICVNNQITSMLLAEIT